MEKQLSKIRNEFNKNPWDVHRCFHIGDFKPFDKIHVIKNGERIRGVVKSVDLKNVIIVFQPSNGSGDTYNVGINDVVFLDDNSNTRKAY